MKRYRLGLILLILLGLLAFAACGDDDDDDDNDEQPSDDDGWQPECPTDQGYSATSAGMTPQQDPAYYIEQSSKYFDTLDSSADPASIPDYSELVARWEWPPWLKLTGLGAEQMILIDYLLQLYPTTVPVRDCRAFQTQPFGRCHVVFFYQDRPCPIYEEFTFNDQGEITFIEAWSDFPGLLPTQDPNDYWAQGENVNRLSTKIPGLGNEIGYIDLYGQCLRQAAAEDEEIADFLMRAQKPVLWWLSEFLNNPDSFAVGCGWETGTKKSTDCAFGEI